MSADLFASAIDEASQWDLSPEIILYGNGEPLLHKNLVSFVRLCSEKNLKSNLSTNVMLADANIASLLSDAGLSMIKLSFWGDNREEYESRTRMQSFEQATEKALEFIRHSSSELKIAINVVKYRGENNSLEPRSSFMKLFESYENVQIYSFYGSDWRGTLPIPELKIPLTGQPKPNPCHLAGDMITMAWDGQFSLCWLDYTREFDLGMRFTTTGDLLKFWSSEARMKYIRMMQSGLFRDIDLCVACSAPYSETDKPRFFKDNKKSGICRGTHIFEPEFPTNKAE